MGVLERERASVLCVRKKERLRTAFRARCRRSSNSAAGRARRGGSQGVSFGGSGSHQATTHQQRAVIAARHVPSVRRPTSACVCAPPPPNSCAIATAGRVDLIGDLKRWWFGRGEVLTVASSTHGTRLLQSTSVQVRVRRRGRVGRGAGGVAGGASDLLAL